MLPIEPLECGSSLFQLCESVVCISFQLCVQWCQFCALKLVWKEYLHLGNQQVPQNSFSPSKELDGYITSKSLDIIQITVYYHKLGMILLVPGALYKIWYMFDYYFPLNFFVVNWIYEYSEIWFYKWQWVFYWIQFCEYGEIQNLESWNVESFISFNND